MSRSKSYTVGGRFFARQADLDAAVKQALNSHPRNTLFEDAFLAACVNNLHPDVLNAEVQVVRFEYLDWREQWKRGMQTASQYRGGGIVLGLFEPLGEWFDVTVYPWRRSKDHRTQIKQELRTIINPLLPKPSPLDRCAVSDCTVTGLNLEYEHASPTFDSIAEECLALMSEAEIENLFGKSKFVRGRENIADCIPATHPAVMHLHRSHMTNTWLWLCAHHHRNVAVPA